MPTFTMKEFAAAIQIHSCRRREQDRIVVASNFRPKLAHCTYAVLAQYGRKADNGFVCTAPVTEQAAACRLQEAKPEMPGMAEIPSVHLGVRWALRADNAR